MRAIVSRISGDKYPIVTNEVVNVDNYKDYYPLLEAELFDVVRVLWRGKEISIFVDDEGMMKSGNIGRTFMGYEQPLFGNVVICGGVDSNGETMDLPDEFDLFSMDIYIGSMDYVIH